MSLGKDRISNDTFYCIGISYKMADESVRGLYSLGGSEKEHLLSQYKSDNLASVFIISTCNRTEIYGLATHPFKLIKAFIEFVKGDMSTFEQNAYIYKNNEAINHLFRVGTGLDSQILGDFEIVSQLKRSFNLSKEKKLVDTFLERLFNSVVKASKQIKNQTELSSGATSVAFAAVQYILNNCKDISHKNILLFGTGKIGRNTCENLVKHIDHNKITLINRTQEKAENIAVKFHLIIKKYEDFSEQLQSTDILVVATGSQKPTITKEMIPKGKQMLILDLSIPKNVSDDIDALPNVTVLHIDCLSQITDNTIEKRRKEMPKAEVIVEQVKLEFEEWLETRKFAPVIQALKEKLNDLTEAEIDFQSKKIKDFKLDQANIITKRFVQKITTHFANHLKDSNNTSDESLKLIQQVFQL